MRTPGLSTPVALIFFARPETFAQVFAQVRAARPAQLFLIQDGPRTHRPDDMEKIEACRAIAEQIDWDCEVLRNYSPENMGCGARPYSGISWVFEHVDRAMILEDDCVPGPSFFPFCEELLERYQADQRVIMISGLNHHVEHDCGKYSYCFAKTGAIGGWATWRDRWQHYDFDVAQLDDAYLTRLLAQATPTSVIRRRMTAWLQTRAARLNGQNLPYWDVQWGLQKFIQSGLAIVPKYNQIHNIGFGVNATHSGGSVKHLPAAVARYFYAPTPPLEFPLVHPSFVLADADYDRRVYATQYPNLLTRIAFGVTCRVKRLFG